MKSADKLIERQLPYLAMLGPFVIVTALLIVLMKTSFEYAYLPLLGLIGTGLCWKWKRQGLIISLAFLAIGFLVIAPEDRLWHIAFGISLALAFIIGALTFEEIDAHEELKRQESSRHQTALSQLESRLQSLHNEHQNECNAFSAKIRLIEQSAADREAFLKNHCQTIEIIRKELNDANTRQEKLTEELFQKRTEFSLTQTQLEEARSEVKKLLTTGTPGDDHEMEIQLLTEKLGQREKNLSELHLQLQNTLEEMHRLKKQIEASAHELAAEKELSNANKAFYEQAQKEQLTQQNIVQELQELIDTQSREKELLGSMFAQLQREGEAHREQDQHHVQLIKTHETMIDLLKRTLEEQEHRLQHEKEKAERTQAQQVEKEQGLLQQIDGLNQQSGQVQQQLMELKQKASDKNDVMAKLEEACTQLQSLVLDKEALQLQLNALLSEHTASTALLSEATQAWRRNEGMYIQLRQQFAEKSSALDDARRQLFHTQELLSRLQHDQAEAKIYQRSPEDRTLDRHIIHMEQLIQEYQQEVDALHELVAFLSG